MGLGGILGFNVDGIPEKLAFHVVDQFDARIMSLNLGSRASYWLHNGYVKDKVLKRLNAETRFEDYNWCGFIVDCLRKCKKKWRPWDRRVADLEHRRWGLGIHFWTREMLTRRQDYEIMTWGFGRGQAKSLSDGSVEKHVVIKDGVNCVEKWVNTLVAQRAKIEKALGDRLNEDPNNEVHQMLKRKYIEVLDVLPCFPAEGLEAFEDGEMLKRAITSTSSPPTAMTGILLFFTYTTPCVF
ncbi:hypothetical protein Hanom_Chr09g00770241 [Helianthus anomalus]